MKTRASTLSVAAMLLLGFIFHTASFIPSAGAQPTAFTHQGFLTMAGSPANGPSDLTFTLFDAVSGGSPVGTSNVLDDLNITNGLYTVALDFGAGSLAGARWLEIAVRPGASTGAYTNLAPRVALTTVPYAAAAGTADTVTGTVNASQIAGAISSNNIAAGSLTSAMLANGAVGSAQLAANAVQSANIATGAVGSAQMADFAVTETKLRLGAEAGTQEDGLIAPGTGTLDFTRTFAYPFTAAPSVTLLSGGWTPGAVTASNFFASLPFTPVVLGSTGDVGQYTSLAIIGGTPAISYFDVTNGDLKFIRANDASGMTWGPPVTVDSTGTVGRFASLATVNGNPAISYRAASGVDLKYVRATDAGGTAWGTPVIVDSSGDVGTYTSLEVVNGLPAISYYDVTNGDLKYVRATDADGTTWGTPVTVDSTGNVGQYTTLLVVDFRPAISYYDVTNGDLKYVHAADADGTIWGTPVTVDSANNVGQFASMALIGGNPAISYRDNTTTDLKYVRATNPDGTAWGTPVIVESSALVNYLSLTEINGRPAISYQRGGGIGDLRYVRATDAVGAAWATPVTLDSIGTVGQYTSLRQVNGRPAISYYDLTNGDLKFAVVPELGMRWQASDGTVAPLVATTVTEGAIGTSQLASNAVQSQNIAGGAVGSSQLASNAVQSGNIAAGAVGSTQIASGAVGNSQLASDLALGGTTTGTFSGSLSGNASTATSATTAGSATNFTGSLAGDVTGTQGATTIAANAVTSAKIADGTIATADIAAGAVTAAKLGADVGFWSVNGANVYRGSGNVGIGINPPASLLHLQGGSEQLRFSKGGGGAWNTAMGLSDADPNIFVLNSRGDVGIFGAIQLATGGTNRMTIGSAAQGGNVGIGTSTPTAKLEVAGTFKAAGFRIETPVGDAAKNLIGGYSANSVKTDTYGAVIAGGGSALFGANSVGVNSDASFIGAGENNHISSNSFNAVIVAGWNNSIGASSDYSFIGGGRSNKIADVALHAMIPGGRENEVGAFAQYAFAAGRRAKANHQGTFVWADSQNADFASTGNDQFLIRASAGVGINTTSPQADLHVQGGLIATVLPFGDHANVQWNSGTGQFYYDNSSRRFKENIKPLEDDFDLLLQAEPRTYTRPAAPGRWEIGFIAEEFDAIGLKKLVDYEADGKTPAGINYEKICLYLTEIAKNQRDQINAQQEEKDAEIAELKQRLSALEKLLNRLSVAKEGGEQ